MTQIEEYEPLVTCPTCGKIVEDSCGGVRGEKDKIWQYYDTICDNCHTKFIIGEITDKCALCHEPFRSPLVDDINEFYHHWCRRDGKNYSTPCYMQRFFDGFVDIFIRDVLWLFLINNEDAAFCAALF